MQDTKEKKIELVSRIKEVVSKWRDAREVNDVVKMQQVRDEMSDVLLDLGLLESEFESILREREQDEAECMEDALEAIKAEYEGKRIGMEHLKNKVKIDCREQTRAVMRADIEFRYVKRLTQRCDQILNAVASGIKVILKID